MMYSIHRNIKIADVMILYFIGPPSSAPINGTNLLTIKMTMHMIANMQNMTTEKPSESAPATLNVVPLAAW